MSNLYFFNFQDSAYDGKMLPQILGRDFSGVVEHVGSAVTRVYPGDEVGIIKDILGGV